MTFVDYWMEYWNSSILTMKQFAESKEGHSFIISCKDNNLFGGENLGKIFLLLSLCVYCKFVIRKCRLTLLWEESVLNHIQKSHIVLNKSYLSLLVYHINTLAHEMVMGWCEKADRSMNNNELI